MSTTRIKVPRLLLIERIQERIKKDREEYDEKLKEYEETVAKAGPTFLKKLSELSARISAMNADELVEYMADHSTGYYRGDDRRNTVSLTIDVKLPFKPTLDVRYAERALRILEASTDETISVSTRDEWFMYL